MASELRVNTLKDAAGANSVAMQYVAGGSAKHWVRFLGTGTVAIRDSLSASSLTDNGTGSYTVAITNSLTDANYCLLIGETDWRCCGAIDEAAITTSDYDMLSRSPNNATSLDSAVTSVAIQGDLA